jgi:protein TonB
VAPTVQQLTYGQGEGRQPAPDYPPEAIAARHQGNVRVRLSVGDDGRVLTAQVVGPCPWSPLNQSALRAVRDRWRFHPGPTRLYEVIITFQIKQ